MVRPGQTAVLKAGVRIVSVVKEGAIDATSTCTNVQDAIDNAENMACFRVMWVAEGNENNDTGPFSWTNGDMKVMGFGIADRFYDMNNFTFNVFITNDERSNAFVAKINAASGNDALTKPHSMYQTGEIGERDEFQFIFSAPESLGLTAYLKISSPSSGDSQNAVARFYAERCDGCCPATS